MIRRNAIIFSVSSVLLIVIIGLAWAVVTLNVANGNQSVSLYQEQVRVLGTYARDMVTQTQNLFESFRRYREYTEGDQLEPNASGYINFLSALESRSFILLDYEANSAYSVIQANSYSLASFDVNHGMQYRLYDDVYSNVSETVKYAVDQIDWTRNGRFPSGRSQLMYDLCHILGADAYLVNGNTTELTGITHSYFQIYAYWNSKSRSQPNDLTNEEVLTANLDWAIGNATQLYQNLAEWHNSNA